MRARVFPRHLISYLKICCRISDGSVRREFIWVGSNVVLSMAALE
jgi:hypothetical protein